MRERFLETHKIAKEVVTITRQQIYEHFSLVGELIDAQSVLDGLKDSSSLKAHQISDLPQGSSIANPVEAFAIEKALAEERVAKLEKQVQESQKPVEEWINSLPDFYLCTILRLHFLHGLSWATIADSIGGGNTKQSVQMMCFRAFDKHFGKKTKSNAKEV